MRVAGTVAEWEEWTEIALPESGAYVVPGALVPVEIDRERDEGVYVEPNVWMVHPPAKQSPHGNDRVAAVPSRETGRATG
jgi:hypothetical protein